MAGEPGETRGKLMGNPCLNEFMNGLWLGFGDINGVNGLYT